MAGKMDVLLFEGSLLGVRALERQPDGELLDERAREAGVCLPTLEDQAHERLARKTNRPVRLVLSLTARELVRVEYAHPSGRERDAEAGHEVQDT